MSIDETNIFKMTNEERYRFMWNNMLLHHKVNLNAPISSLCIDNEIPNEPLDVQEYVLFGDNNPNDMYPNRFYSDKTRMEILKDKFRLAIVYINMKKHDDNSIEYTVVPSQLFIGWDEHELNSIGGEFANPNFIDTSRQSMLSKHARGILYPRPAIQATWYTLVLDPSQVQFQEVTTPKVVKNTSWTRIFKKNKIVHDTSIILNSKIKLNLCEIKDKNGNMSICPLFDMDWITPQYGEFGKVIAEEYRNTAHKCNSNAFLICGGFEYHSMNNICEKEYTIQKYLSCLTPLSIQPII